MLYKHIVVAVDLTELSLITTEKAKEMADKFGATLNLLHVVEPIPVYGFSYVQITDVEMEIVSQAQEQVEQIAEKYDVSPDCQTVERGFPKHVILDYANSVNADLIVLGSHKDHSGAHIIGSTTSSIIHHADCDVWVVRS